MGLTLEQTKVWLRIDDDNDDENELLQDLIYGADTYLCNALGFEPASDDPLARLFCRVLVADWYENRHMVGKGGSEKVRFTIQSILMQLRYGQGDGK